MANLLSLPELSPRSSRRRYIERLGEAKKLVTSWTSWEERARLRYTPSTAGYSRLGLRANNSYNIYSDRVRGGDEDWPLFSLSESRALGETFLQQRYQVPRGVLNSKFSPVYILVAGVQDCNAHPNRKYTNNKRRNEVLSDFAPRQRCLRSIVHLFTKLQDLPRKAPSRRS